MSEALRRLTLACCLPMARTVGTLDGYLTGEHDKRVRYVWRFPPSDRIVLEVHGLPIGERDTKVLEFTYNRREQSAGKEQ